MSTSSAAKRIEAYAGRPEELIQALQAVQEAVTDQAILKQARQALQSLDAAP